MREIGLLFLFLLGALGWGSIIARGVGLRDRLQPEFYLFAFGLGLGLLAHLLFGLGVVGVLYPAVGWILLIVSGVIGIFELVRHRLVYGQAWRSMGKDVPITWFSVVLSLVILLGLSYPLFTDALVPPLSWDEIAYHLPIPQFYVQNHALTYIPFIPYANWPHEFELLFTLSLLLSAETLAHLMVWSTLVLICGGLYLFGRRYFCGQMGLLAAALFAITPMVGMLAGTALIELPLAFYTLLAAYALTLWWFDQPKSNIWVVSAIFGGFVASIKLNGAVTPLLLALLMAGLMLLRAQVRPSVVLKQFVCYGLIAFAIVAPWYIKTWLYTGNPFWPFGQQWLGARDWDALGSEYLLGFIRSPNTPLTPLDWLLNLRRVAVSTAAFGPPRMILGWVYLVLVPLAILALLLERSSKRSMVRWLALLSLILYTSWFFQTHQTRFLLPATPIFALLAAAGAEWLWQRKPWPWRTLMQAALCIMLIATTWLVVPGDRTRFASRWPFLMGNLSYAEFLQTHLPGYDAYAYVNQNLSENAKLLLFLYESRGYYLQRDYMWANPMGQRVLRLEQFANSGQLAAELHRRGFTHLFFNQAQVDPYRNIRYGDAITQLAYDLLRNHARRLYQSGNIEVYELLP